jgi:hypothetical protein
MAASLGHGRGAEQVKKIAAPPKVVNATDNILETIEIVLAEK